MKVKKVKIVRGDILVDISKEKLEKLLNIVVEKGLESFDEALEELDILLFLDCTGKHESRYLELRRVGRVWQCTRFEPGGRPLDASVRIVHPLQ